jgi:hypothetical protein
MIPVVVLCVLLHYLAQRKSGFRLTYPVSTMLGLEFTLAFAAHYLPLAPSVKVFLWTVFILFGKYLWFLAYSLREANDPETPPLILQFGHYRPFWWYASPLPIPKGSAYLRRIEAKTDIELALCQLKGLKLLMWAIYLELFLMLINGVLSGYGSALGHWVSVEWHDGMTSLFIKGSPVWDLFASEKGFVFPTYVIAYSSLERGESFGALSNWGSLLIYFTNDIGNLAVITHKAIAICRMCGFNALRNVYNPLQSNSIADFWNRYYYYFKEMLVAIFFYPAYFSFFKKSPRMRLLVATFCAVSVGNILFHYFLNLKFVVSEGPIAAMAHFQSFSVYTIVLTFAIYLSQRRKMDKTIPQRNSLLNTAGILGVYAVLSIFADLSHVSLSSNFAYFLSLFGM